MSESPPTQLADLPFDILVRIADKLDYKSLHNLSLVDKKLNSFGNDNYLWKRKLLADIQRWRMIDSKTFPSVLFDSDTDADISFKRVYLECCPELLTRTDILKKLETFQQLHLTSTSERLSLVSGSSGSGVGCISASPNFTLSSLSSLAMPMMVFGQVKEFVYRNVFSPDNSSSSSQHSRGNSEYAPNKIVMFGPGLETTTSCLVTNILWKSEFKTIGMIPGKDGYGSGIELKLYNHKPFNLTILYTNVSKVRNNSDSRPLSENRLFQTKSDKSVSTADDEDTYELQPQVREACADALGFIYVIDNKNLSKIKRTDLNSYHIQNYKTELTVLMKQVNPNLPLLILSCNTNEEQNEKVSTVDSFINDSKVKSADLSCLDIIQELELHKLKNTEWQIRNCELFQHKMKDIVLGFEWMLNKLDQKYLTARSQFIANEKD